MSTRRASVHDDAREDWTHGVARQFAGIFLLAIGAIGFLAAAQRPALSAWSPVAGVRLNVNTATPTELEALPGIGPALALRIVAHREEHGPFAEIANLEDVHRVGPRTVLRLEQFLTATDDGHDAEATPRID